MRSVSRPALAALWRTALRLGVAAALLGGPAFAADTGNGSKNFRTPTAVPNYFSNEGGPLIGGPSESRRGELYPSQTATGAPPQQNQVATAPPPRIRQHVAIVVPHGRALHGRRGTVAAHHAVHGRARSRVLARGVSRGHSLHTVRASHSAGRTTRISNVHHHARG
jgi:hypothetical protein